jgi:hypothetical protein
MTLEIPEIKEILTRMERIEQLLSSKDSWLSKSDFCKKFDIPESTFNVWRSTGEIVTKKIGKHVFVDVLKSMR